MHSYYATKADVGLKFTPGLAPREDSASSSEYHMSGVWYCVATGPGSGLLPNVFIWCQSPATVSSRAGAAAEELFGEALCRGKEKWESVSQHLAAALPVNDSW